VKHLYQLKNTMKTLSQTNIQTHMKKTTTTTTTTVVTVTEENPSKGGSLAVFALDKSGSMSWKSNAAIEGFNGYLEGIKESVDFLTLGQFNETLTKTYDIANTADVEPLSAKTYTPGGGTSLYDAIGTLVKETEAYLEANPGKIDEVIVTIFTDGEENTSRTYSLASIKALITKKEAEGNWTFVFMGSELNTYQQGASMGFSNANTRIYAAVDTSATMRSMGATTASYMARPNKLNKEVFTFESGNTVTNEDGSVSFSTEAPITTTLTTTESNVTV